MYCILCQTRTANDKCKSCGTGYCFPCQMADNSMLFRYRWEKDDTKPSGEIQRTVACINCINNTKIPLRIAFGCG